MDKLHLVLLTDLQLLDPDTDELLQILEEGSDCYIAGIECSDDIIQDVNYRVIFGDSDESFVIECLGETVEELFEIA